MAEAESKPCPFPAQYLKVMNCYSHVGCSPFRALSHRGIQRPEMDPIETYKPLRGRGLQRICGEGGTIRLRSSSITSQIWRGFQKGRIPVLSLLLPRYCPGAFAL